MEYKVTSNNTKRTLAASLKKFMEKKPLSKITVSEIVQDCGLNRKTFYYHFEDIYDLLKWMLDQEAVEVVRNFDLFTEYEEAIRFVIDYVDRNSHILNCALDTVGRHQLKQFFYNDFIGIMHDIVVHIEEVLEYRLDDSFRDFLCSFYTEAVAGSLITLFEEGEQQQRDVLVDEIACIFRSSLPAVIQDAGTPV